MQDDRAVTSDEAREWVLRFCYHVRRNSLRRIRIMKHYNDMHKNVPVVSLLEGTKIEFNSEITETKRFKERMEGIIGQSIGEIIDPDGRQI